MIKRIYDLKFNKDNRFVIYKRLAIFGIFVKSKRVATFSDINDAVNFLKQLI